MITVEAKALAVAMKRAANIVESSNTIPILNHVCLQAESGTLLLSTSDLDVELAQEIALVEGGALSATVDAKRLAQLAQAVPGDAQITMESDDEGRLAVKCARSRWLLPCLPPADFPHVPFAGEQLIEVAFDVFTSAAARVAPMVSTEKGRYYLCGTYVDTEDGCLRMVSTNGHCGMIVPLATEHAPPPDLIVPPKLLNAVRAFEYDGDIAIALGDKRMQVRVGTAVVTGKAIDGTFPDYRRVWPAEQDAPVRVDPAALRAAIRRVTLVSEGKTRSVKVARAAGKLVLSVTSPEHGTASEEVPAECSETFDAGFNAQYLENMLDAVGGDTIEIHHADAGAPALFRRTVDDGARGVLMPMRI